MKKVFVLATVLLSLAARGQLTPQMARDVHRDIEPAICVISYTIPVETQHGRQQEDDRNALGVIVSEDGLVMAYGHMALPDSEPYNIRAYVGHKGQQQELEATYLGKSADVNISFLQLAPEEPDARFDYVQFDRDAELDLAEPVTLFGLLGKTFDYSVAVTTSRIGAVLDEPRRTYVIADSLSYGFVGGPVANTQGQLVGVVGMDLSPEEGGEFFVRHGRPLVYQTALFHDYIDAPPTTALPTGDDAAWLGVFTQPLDGDMARYWELDLDGGVVVSTVIEGSPAAQAGIKRGDVIVTFNGASVQPRQRWEMRGFTKLVREAGAGQQVPVEFVRAGKRHTLTVTLAAHPQKSSDAPQYEDAILGLTVRNLTTDVRLLLSLEPEFQGVIVRDVKSGSYAQEAGMLPGVIILRIGEHDVTSIEDYEQAVERIVEEQPGEVPVFCRVGPVTRFFRLQPRWR